MADLKLIGAVAIKVRPDARDFKEETQKQINSELGPSGDKVNAKVKVKVAADTTAAKVEIKRLEDEVNGKKLNLNVGMDYDGVKRAREQIDQALRSLDNKVIKVTMDRDGLNEAKAKLKELSQNAKVDFKFVRDEAGYRSILQKIKRIREEKGMTSTWKFKTDTASLAEAEKKAKEALARLEAKKTITLNYSKDYDGVKQAIGEIDKRLDKLRELKLKTKLDKTSLEEAKAKLTERLQTAPVTVKFNEDKKGYETILSRIKAIQREKLEKEFKFTTDDAGLFKAESEIRAKIQALADATRVPFHIMLSEDSKLRAEKDAKDVKQKIDSMKAAIKLELAGEEMVAAQLRFVGRDRVVNFLARVNTGSLAAAEGMLKSLGGINTLSSMGKFIEGVFTKFDTFSLKIAAVATALGGLVNVSAYAGTAVFKVGEGVVQSLGLLAAAPAILGAATAAYTIFTAGFNNFFDAFNKDPKIAEEAMSRLPPLAKKTVESITGLYRGLADPIQEKFWGRVGTTLSDAIEKLYPEIKTGLLQSTEAVGDFVAGFGRSMTKLSLNGDIKILFANFRGFFVNLSKASEPFFDAWNKFGVKGSELLPRFGQWIADMAVKFDEFATKNSKNGKILDWIQQGVNSLRNMWQIGGSVIDIFKGITRAAGLAGTGGLAEFNNRMRDIADKMLSEPWQSKAATIFEGARKGASGINRGFQDLIGTLGNASGWLGTVLTQLGNIGGESLSRLADLFGRQNYQDGVSAELQGMQKLVDGLGPAFQSLGDIIGNMSMVAGAVFGNMPGLINQILGLLDSVTTRLSTNLADVAPKMVNTISGIFTAITPLIEGAVTIVDGLLTVVGAVPDSFVALAVAASAFFALRGLSSKFFDTFKQGPMFKDMQSRWLEQEQAAGRTLQQYKLVNGELKQFTVPSGQFSAVKQGWSEMREGAGQVRGSIREMYDMARVAGKGMSPLMAALTTTGTIAGSTIKTLGSGLMGALGGPWGLAIAGAGLAIGAFAQSQQEAKAHVDELTAALDEQTKSFSKTGLDSIAKSWSDIGKSGDGWANLTRGSKAANETAELLKMNLSGITRTIAEGGPKADELVNNLDGLAGALGAWEVGNQNMAATGKGLQDLKGDVDNAASAFGLTADEIAKMGLKSADIAHLEDNIRKETASAALAKKVFEGMAEATGTTSTKAQLLSQAMTQIGDESQTAASKIGAIKQALDILNNGGMSAREAEVAAQQAGQSAVEQAAALKEQLAGGQALLRATDGMIDTTSAAGLKLQQTMSGSADSILVHARAVYEAAVKGGKTPAAAMKDAQAIIDGGDKELQRIADAAGVPVEKLKKEWETFFGADWTLTATFTASALQFEAAKKATEESGRKWDKTTYEAFLKANPDPAKLTVDQASQWAEDYANQQYQAQLKAINPQALDTILKATGQAKNYKDGNYTAVMKALNAAGPGAAAALQVILGVKNGNYAAAIKTYMDAVTAANVRAELDRIANARRVAVISVQYADSKGPAVGTAGRGLVHAQGMNGFLSNGDGSYHPRFLPKFVQAYADGGIGGGVLESPDYAKIYKPASQFRIFAEPSTGGEAFIPMAASKRSRSTAILREVAAQFGYQLTKPQAFADGGVVGAGGRNRQGGNVAVNIDSYIQQSNNTADDVARAIMRRVKSRGVYSPLEGF